MKKNRAVTKLMVFSLHDKNSQKPINELLDQGYSFVHVTSHRGDYVAVMEKTSTYYKDKDHGYFYAPTPSF